MQDGDVYKTHSNIDLLEAITGFRPKTYVKEYLNLLNGTSLIINEINTVNKFINLY